MDYKVSASEEQNPNPIAHPSIQVTQPVRTLPYTAKSIVGVSLALVLVAELVTDFLGVIPGLALYTLLLLAFTIYPYYSSSPAVPRIYHALTLLPLMRLLSLVMPIPNASPLLQYALIGLPVLFSALVTARLNRLSSIRINLSWAEVVVQFLFGLSGIPFGILAALIIPAPADIQLGLGLGTNILLWVVLTVFVTLSEEIIFRGLLQKSLASLFGSLGVILSSLVYMSMLLGSISIPSILYFGLTGLIFGMWVQFTDSLWGAVMSHSLMNLIFILLIVLK